MNAVDNVRDVIAPYFRGRDLASASFLELDRALLQLERSTAERRGKLSGKAGSPEGIAIAQRKQNLGMNAILATSLAIARAVAHVQGKQLWELIREEMLGIIEKLATANGVSIDGSRWEDYVSALREVGVQLTANGVQIHEQLRKLTGVYEDPHLAPPSSLPLMADTSADTSAARAAAPTRVEAAAPDAGSDADADAATDHARIALPEPGQRTIREVSTALHHAFVMGEDTDERRKALRQYIWARKEIMKTVRPFEIVNDRIVRSEDRLVVAYLAGDDLLVHIVREGEVSVTSRPIRPGTILTDKLLADMTAIEGLVIDLESQLYGYDVDTIPEVRISRIRDMVSQLRELETTANYYRAAIHLRCLVVRLCEHSFRGFLGAKNLRPEVRQLGEEIAKLLNGPFADRLRLAMRVLVRNVAGLLLRPSLIDQVWNDAIDLSEVQVRGSRIVNELRRSSHHALGMPTLELATAYHEYLQTGDMSQLNKLDFDSVSPADEAARQKTAPRALVERIVNNMEKLLGSAEIITRIHEWQDAYSEALVRCDFGKSLDEELEAIVTGGLRARNRWVFHHHIRILSKKTTEVAPLLDDPQHERDLLALNEFDPASPSFDAEHAEREVRSVVTRLERALRERCQEPLFELIDKALATYEQDAFLESIRILARLRYNVGVLIEAGGFEDQRYLLYQLDCLLEEMGYLSVRHIASIFERDGLLLEECFEIIAITAKNLSQDGLHSDDMIELANMLSTPGRSNVELLDILKAILDCYHRILQRTSMTFEPLGKRLELSTDDLRIVVANLQRYMHDLNSIAHLADLAESHLRALEDDPSTTAQRRGQVPEFAPFDILHLSDRDEIATRINKRELCLQDRFGGKGAGLIRISHAGIPTRDGFIVPTDLARSGIHDSDPEQFEHQIAEHLRILEQDISRREGSPARFGNTEHPLLLAVRGGSVFSMPGILSTIVFVGINDEIAESLAEEDPWYAYDTYRRFLTSWGGAVMGVELERFNLVEGAKRSHGIQYKNDLPWQAMREIAENCKNILRQHGRPEVLDEALRDPDRQLIAAVRAVLGSWNTERAQRYREIKGISETWNTAVLIQQMASGNRRNAEVCEGMDETNCSLTGVIPHTMVTRLGLRRLTGDIKFSASGDDLVGGLTAADSFEPISNLRSLMPMLERRIDHAGTRIRLARGTDIELEFTVERGVLSILQARTASTALREDVNSFDKPGEPIATAIGIRGGAFRGRVAFDVEDLTALSEVDSDDSDGVLLLLENPTPAEIPMILSADGLLAARGGSTSHAAVALHGIQDRPFSAVLGATALQVDAASHRATLVDRDGGNGEAIAEIEAGDIISIDGRTGAIWIGPKPLLKPAITKTDAVPNG
jgi:phosphohistidine swiveling domain-containing protein